MENFVKVLPKVQVMEAHQLCEDTVIQTGAKDAGVGYEGIPNEEKGRAGDWVVIHPRVKRVWTNEDFQNSYDIIAKSTSDL